MKQILKTRTKTKRWLALALCLCMAFPSATTLVSVAEEPAGTSEFCLHHTEHTPECGYVAPVEEQPCTHVHDGDCGYQAPTEGSPCNHVHDDSCGYQEPTEGVSCNMGCTDEDGDGNIIHQEGCAYQPAEAGQPCTHSHDENCGYQAASEGSPCAHVHDETCGYVEATAGQPCDHTHTDACYTVTSACTHTHTDECYQDDQLVCTHALCSEETGCLADQNGIPNGTKEENDGKQDDDGEPNSGNPTPPQEGSHVYVIDGENKTYETLKEAVSQAESDSTIQLTDDEIIVKTEHTDQVYGEQIVVTGKTITIDLNGHTVKNDNTDPNYTGHALSLIHI